MKIALIILIMPIPVFCFGQKTVILSNYSNQVPTGKKWILPTNQEIMVEVTYGVLNSGTLCNARFLSNPHILTGIFIGDYGRPNEVYSILFKDFSKVAYTNNFTYSITPVSYVSSEVKLSQLYSQSTNYVGQNQIAFTQGQKVYVGECLISIQVMELDLSPKEFYEISKKEEEKRLAEERRKRYEEDKERQAEIELKEKVKNSNTYFFSPDLSNEKEINISISKTVLFVLNDYFQIFKKDYIDGYNNIIEAYQRNLEFPSSDSINPEDYNLYDLSLYFDRTRKLSKITVDGVLIKGKGTTNIEIPAPYLDELSKQITLNKCGVISIENKDYNVNSYFLFLFTPTVSEQECRFEISKNRKGEIKFITHSNFSDDVALQLLRENSKTKDLNEGDYEITVLTTNTRFLGIHFQDYNQKETIVDSTINREIEEFKEF